MDESRYLCYLEKCNRLSSGRVLAKVNNTYYIFNEKQIEFLQYLNNIDRKREEIYREFSSYDIEAINQLIEYFYMKGIIFKKNSLENRGFIFLAKYRKVTRLYIPQKLTDSIGLHISDILSFFPEPMLAKKVMIYFFPALAIFLCHACYDIQLDLSVVPRNLITFLIGSIVAIIHELLVLVYHVKSGKLPGRIYIRFIYFVVVSFGTEWGETYSENKIFRTNMFLFSMISIYYVSAAFFCLFYFFQYLKCYMLAYYTSVYAVGTLIFACINTYPFLLKTDGYILYQEFFDVYKVRSLFFKTLFYYMGMRKVTNLQEIVKRNSLKTYIWDVFFVFSIIGLLYFLYNGIRIIV